VQDLGALPQTPLGEHGFPQTPADVRHVGRGWGIKPHPNGIVYFRRAASRVKGLKPPLRALDAAEIYRSGATTQIFSNLL